jgi:hypothetical protein
MEIDAARCLARQSFKAARNLQDALQFLKERCDPDEYKDFAFDIAKAIDAVSIALLNKALKAHPELEQEIEQQISVHGRYL